MTKNPAFLPAASRGRSLGIRLLAFGYVETQTKTFETFKSWNPLLYPLETMENKENIFVQTHTKLYLSYIGTFPVS